MATILVIDDDPRILEVISRCLEAKGHEVITADSGEKGLKIVGKGWKQPNLIILDVQMEGINGLEVLKKIKQHEKTLAIPVIMLTGLCDKDTMNTAMSEYALKFLTKPIGMTELAESVEKALT